MTDYLDRDESIERKDVCHGHIMQAEIRLYKGSQIDVCVSDQNGNSMAEAVLDFACLPAVLSVIPQLFTVTNEELHTEQLTEA